MSDHDPFSGLTPTRAPSALRGPVLRAARQALAQRAAPHSAWGLLWRSRVLRLGWTAACAMLLAGHIALTLWPRRSPSAAGRLVVTPTREPSPELRDVLYLPPIERLAVIIEYGPPAPDGGAENAPRARVPRKGQGT